MTQYYIYFVHDDGDRMLLTEYTEDNPDINEPPVLARWTPHHKIRAWKMPLLFPTPEQAEVLMDDIRHFFFMEKRYREGVKLGRWVSMDSFIREQSEG